jgi:hypothetical protein
MRTAVFAVRVHDEVSRPRSIHGGVVTEVTGRDRLALRNFPPSISITSGETGKRLKQYEAAIEDPPILPASLATVEVNDLFKRLPGHEREYLPQNEYLFKPLQSTLEDILFLGRSYEPLFDRFEIL